jgi:hypothetical protein
MKAVKTQAQGYNFDFINDFVMNKQMNVYIRIAFLQEKFQLNFVFVKNFHRQDSLQSNTVLSRDPPVCRCPG